MKVWQLEKIVEEIVEENIEISRSDYEAILSMSTEDINYLLQKIEEKNKKTNQLLGFIIYTNFCKNWDEEFNHLEGIENFNIKEYILNKIANAPSRSHAEEIYQYCDLKSIYGSSKLPVLRTVEEWKTYIEAITHPFMLFNRDRKILNNLEFILKNNSEEDRCNLIKKVMQYSQSESLDVLDLSNYSEILKEMPAKNEDLVDLLLKGYDFNYISELLVLWTKRHNYVKRNNGDVDEIDAMHQEIVNYLKNSNAMTSLNLKHLIGMLTYFKYKYYMEYTKLLKEIEAKEDWKLFGICIYDQVFLGYSCIRDYLEKVFSTSSTCKDELFSRRDALINLLRGSSNILSIPRDTYHNDGWPEKMTVVEFLDNYNIDNKALENYKREEIVENFNDGDEVTSKILDHFLVKKYKYKILL